jgi:aminoglycoside phosphotransferase (APT) family kinase protein
MHADQLTVTVETVRALVDDQFPQWRGLPVTPVASPGTVNAIFLVGDRLAARLPLQPRDPQTVRAALGLGAG